MFVILAVLFMGIGICFMLSGDNMGEFLYTIIGAVLFIIGIVSMVFISRNMEPSGKVLIEEIKYEKSFPSDLESAYKLGKQEEYSFQINNDTIINIDEKDISNILVKDDTENKIFITKTRATKAQKILFFTQERTQYLITKKGQ